MPREIASSKYKSYGSFKLEVQMQLLTDLLLLKYYLGPIVTMLSNNSVGICNVINLPPFHQWEGCFCLEKKKQTKRINQLDTKNHFSDISIKRTNEVKQRNGNGILSQVSTSHLQAHFPPNTMYFFKYSQTCVQRPPLGPEKSGRCSEVVVIQRVKHVLN